MKSLIPWRNKSRNTDLAESWDTGVRHFRNEMDHLFERFFNEPIGRFSEVFGVGQEWAPSLDLVETDKHVTVTAEIPGVDPKDIDISISGNVLTVTGEKREVNENKGDNWFHSERRFGSFRRSVQLPSTADTEKVSAEHVNGVLTVKIQKLTSATPKRVPVKTN